MTSAAALLKVWFVTGWTFGKFKSERVNKKINKKLILSFMYFFPLVHDFIN